MAKDEKYTVLYSNDYIITKEEVAKKDNNVSIEYRDDGFKNKDKIIYGYHDNDHGNDVSPKEITEHIIKKEVYNMFRHGNKNIFLLAGAGSSIKPDKQDDDNNSGKTMHDLANTINDTLQNDTQQKEKKKLLLNFKDLAQKCHIKLYDEKYYQDISIDKLHDKDEKDINNLIYDNFEYFLTQIERAKEFLDDDDSIHETLEFIYSEILKNCNLTLSSDGKYPHKSVINKLVKLNSHNDRLKIFTTNYDNLFEQAISELKYIAIDGFTYDTKRQFMGELFDWDFVNRKKTNEKENTYYIPNVVQMYKLHGSIDWYEEGDSIVKKPIENYDIEHKNIDIHKHLMVFPRSNKYEQSFEEPYFEMFLRFQQQLRQKNGLLIVVGFSFGDKHIRNMVENAIKTNESLSIIVSNYNIDDDSLEWLKNLISANYNVILVSGDFKDFEEYIPNNDLLDTSIYSEENNL